MPNFDKKSLFQRLIQVRVAHYGQRGASIFAADLGITPSTYYYYEKNRVPPIDILLKVSQLCNVSLEWLLTGENEQKNSKNLKKSEKIEHSFTKNLQKSSAFNEIYSKIDAILTKNPAAQVPLNIFLDMLAEKNKIENLDQKSTDIQRQITEKKIKLSSQRIPIFGRTAAGTTALWNKVLDADEKIKETNIKNLLQKYLSNKIVNIENGDAQTEINRKDIFAALKNRQVHIAAVSSDENEIFEFIDCKELSKLYPDAFALKIDGNSMSPKINDGDIVVLSPSEPPQNGKPAVIKIKNAVGLTCKVFVKTANSIHLVPINEKYQTAIIQPEQIESAFAVLCRIRATEEKNF